jgi:hypothetical protein
MTNQVHVPRGRSLVAISVAAIAALAVVLPGSGRGAGPTFASGDIIVADSVHSAIKAVDPVTGAATPVSTAGFFEFPADVTFAQDGDLLVVDRDAFGGKGGIIRVDSATADQTKVSSNALSDAAGGKELFKHPIALDRKGSSLFVADYAPPKKIIKVAIGTGKQSLVSSRGDLNSPFGIVAQGLSKLLVSDAGAYGKGGVMEIDPQTGKQTKVSANGKFKFPQALTLMGSNSALVTNTNSFADPGDVIKVNLQSGAQKRLATGPPLNGPSGIALLDNDTAAVADYTSPFPNGGIYTVDLETGDQTLLNGTDFSNPIGVRIAP